MAKKLKKVKKQMSPKTRNILVNSFKGIISNQACVDNGKEAPWWLAIIFALVSVIIPLIPGFVSLDKAYGASFLNNGSFGIDRGLSEAFVSLKSENKELNIKDGLLTYSGEVSGTKDYDLYKQVTTLSTIQDQEEYGFMLYYTTREGNELQDYVNQKVADYYKVGTLTKKDAGDAEGTAYYIPSFMILTKNTLVAATYKVDSTTRAGNTFGGLDWWTTPNGNLVTYVLEGVESTTVEQVKHNTGDWAKVYNKWKAVFNQTYKNQKERAKWNTTLIYLGVYAGLIVFLGLMVFLLTRGKNNPFNTLNFWVCQKIAYFLSFTPAVLALILGFVFAGNMIGQMAFIMLLSLRIMWASMRQLRPIYQ